MVFIIRKRFIFICVIFISIISVLFGIKIYLNNKKENKILIGADLTISDCIADGFEVYSQDIDFEKYFRPSNLPILNDNKDINKLIWKSENVEYKNVEIPKEYLKSPENTIINYFSLLREAANPEKGKYTGCGSIGEGKAPYPIAYNFFTDEYKEKIKYKQYEDSFKNILHINLIKFKEITQAKEYELKYFYEIETIQGSENGVGYFAYYYGYINLKKENDIYKISNITVTPEEYLCAPYHSWFYDGESSVLVKYGDWCNLIKGKTRIEIDGYIKDIYFEGTDGNKYKIEFYILTNDYDIEVAQFKKNDADEWERIYLNPEDCLKTK